MQTIKLGNITVTVVKKDIKNIHLSVNPPDGRVRISAPLKMNNDTIRVYAISKLTWIRKQQSKFIKQLREPQREYVNLESHYYLGKRYLLEISVKSHESQESSVQLKHDRIRLLTAKEPSTKLKALLLEKWYRERLKELAGLYIGNWSNVLGLANPDFHIRKMRTKWGSCNTGEGRILLNLELIKKPRECVEYIIVHELIHLIEPKHTERFFALLNKHLPHWQDIKTELNKLPVGHINWEY